MTGWLNKWYLRLRYIAGIYISAIPWLYFMLVPKRLRNNIVSKDTDIVIEGYPRSGNSFSTNAFQMAQWPKVNIANHMHSTAQIIRGVKLNKPVILLIRNPVDAIKSHLIRHPALTSYFAALGYYRLYKQLYKYRNSVVIASFDQVTKDFGSIIDLVNEKYNVNFRSFKHTDENVQMIFSNLKKASQRLDRDVEASVAAPSELRESIKQKISLNPDSGIMKKCAALYNNYLELTRR